MDTHNETPIFYRFDSKKYSTTFAAYPVIFIKALQEKDFRNDGPRDIHKFLRNGEYPKWIQFPICFQQIDGKILRDIIESRSVSFDLISLRLRDLLKDNHISGWESYTIQLYDKRGNQIEGYCGFSVIGRGGNIIFKRDGWNLKKEDRIYNVSQWDGSDIFLLGGSIYITESVMKLLQKNKISGAEFVPMQERFTII